MDQSGLSVILPNYNHGRFLRRQLDALAAQSVPPLEIIVIDDASTDDSLEVAEEAAAGYPFIRVLRNDRNMGINGALVRGIREARGAFLFFAAANDRVLPGLFEESLTLLGRHPAAAVCTALAREIDDDDVDLGLRQQPLVLDAPGYIAPGDALEKLFRHDGWFQGNTAVYRRSMFEDLGGFDRRLESFMDSFLCTVLALRHGVCFIPEPLACFRIHHDSYSRRLTSDVEQALRMFGQAKEQMETTYGALFPDDYVKLWDRRWRYTVASNLVKAGETDREKLMALMPRPWLLDRLVFRLLAMFGPMRNRLITLYQLIRLTPRDFASGIRKRLNRERTT